MNKSKTFSISTLVLPLVIIFSQSINADTIGVRAALTQWSPSWDGNLGEGDLEGDMSLDDDDSTGFSIAFEHPVPVLPNIKIQSTPLSTDGSVSTQFNYPATGSTISIGEEIELALDSQDAIFYWQVLDNWISLDLGLAARKYDVEFTHNGTKEVDDSVVLPMLYTGARFDLPLSGFYGRGELLFIGNGDSSIQDFQFGFGYESSIRLGAELGLRSSSISIENVDDVDVDLGASGAFFALTFHI